VDFTEVPTHWQVKRLKHASPEITVGVVVNPSHHFVDDGPVPFLRGLDVARDNICTANAKTISAISNKLLSKSVLRAGDLVSIRVGYPGVTAVVPESLDGANCASLLIIRRPTAVSSRLLCYQLNSAFGQAQVKLLQQGAAQEQINVSDIVEFAVTVPPVDEGTQIAKFLDYETARIDALIEKQQQLIALLQEKRQAVISHAVTKGLNPDAPMRDSGVEWLGKVPAHWTVGRYKFCTTRVVVGIAEAATHAYADIGVPIIRSTNIKEDGLSADGVLYIKAWFAEQNASKFLYAGDIVTVRTGYPGVSAVVPESLDRSQCFTNLVATPRRECVARFLCEFLNSHFGKKYFDMLGWGSAQKNISVPILQNVPVPWPSNEEQCQIVAYIEQQRSKFSNLVSTAERMVDALQERRTALISAAVTGKIDVRTWTPPSTDVSAEVA
jgi:type I restriction enzyme S subunit